MTEEAGTAPALDRLAADHPAAAELLALLAYLGGEDVPLAVIAAAGDVLPERLAPLAADAAALEAAARALEDAGLASRAGDGVTLSDGVRKRARERLDGEPRRTWAEAAARVAARAVPGHPEDPAVRAAWDRFAPLALEAAEACAEMEVGTAAAAHLLSLLGRYCLAQEEFADARELLERAVVLRERSRGPHGPQLAMDITYLNGALQGLGARGPMVENAAGVAHI